MCIITQRNTKYTKAFGLPILPAHSSQGCNNQRSLPINEHGTKSYNQNISQTHSACVLACGLGQNKFEMRLLAP